MPEMADVIFNAAKECPELTVRQIAVMILCGRGTAESRQVKTLADKINAAKPIVSRAGEKLCDLGYLTRSEIQGDRRTCVLSLTEKGASFLAKLGITSKISPTAVVRTAGRPAAARKSSGRRAAT